MIILENFSSSLIEVLNLGKNFIISVSGSGGKTTFCKVLSLELYKKYISNKNISILFSTTTKIGDFLDNEFKKILFNSEEEIDIDLFKKVEGLYLTGIKNDRKISSLPLEILKDVVDKFSYTILEADGSRKKMIKAWNDTEPVYLSKTTTSVGIIPIKAIGMEINELNIHRLEIFEARFNFKKKNKIDIELMTEIITNKEGLFKNSIGKKILFINQVETEEEFEYAKQLANSIEKNNIIEKVIIASLLNKKFYEYKKSSDNL